MTHSQTQGAEGAGTKTAGQMAMPRNKWREPDHHPIIGRWHVRHEIEAAADTGYLFGKNFVTLDDALAFCERQKGQCRLLFHVADDRWLRVDRPFQFYFVGDADRTPAPAATPGVPDSVRVPVPEELAEAAGELAQLVSYSEITGDIRGSNRSPIRKACDAVFDIHRAYQKKLDEAEDAQALLIAAQPAGHTKGSIEHGPGAASMATPDYNISAQPAGQSTDDDTSRCEVCNKPLIAGQRVMQDVELGTVHAACCGPEREAYVKDVETGEPLGPNDPIPHGYVYEGEEPAGQSTGLGADAAAWKERLERAFYDAGGFYGQMVEYAARTALPVVLAAIKPAPDSTRTGAAETSAEDDITQAMIQAGRYAANLNDGTLASIYLSMLAARPEAPSDAGWRENPIDSAIGTAAQAIEYAIGIDDHYDGLEFLKAWSEGDLKEWPEFAVAIHGNSPTPPSDPAPSGQAEG